MRLGGGAGTVRQFLYVGLVDDLHVVIVPTCQVAASGSFDHLDGGQEGYRCIELVSSPAVVNARLSRPPT